MIKSSARIATRHGSRYLTRLCKHWSHKLEIDYSAEQARIPFAADRVCVMQAGPDQLRLEIEAPDGEALEFVQKVVTDHLLRMADRDSLPPIDWQEA